MNKNIKQEIHIYCKNRERHKKRYINKIKYKIKAETHKVKKEW